MNNQRHLFLISAAVASVTACEPPTAPVRDPRCIYKGDTLGVLWTSGNGVITHCDWLIADVTSCGTKPARLSPPACVVGKAA